MASSEKMSSFKLYDDPLCPFAHRAEIALGEKPAAARDAVEVVPLNLRALPQWYLKLNPRETIPALQLPDGSVLPESLPIAQFIDETFEPKNQFLPINGPQRYEILSMIDKANEAVWAGFGLLRGSNKENEAEKRDAFRAQLAALEAEMDPQGPYVMGADFTLVDINTIPHLLRLAAGMKALKGFNVYAEFPRIRKWVNAALRRPSVGHVDPILRTFIGRMKTYARESGQDLTPDWQYTFYAAPQCPFCARVRLLLSELFPKERKESDVTILEPSGDGEDDVATVKIVNLDLDNLPEFYTKEINPAGEVPALTTPFGDPVVGSLNLLSFLQADFPTPSSKSLTPADHLRGRVYLDQIGSLAGAIPHEQPKEQGKEALTEDAKYALEELQRLAPPHASAEAPFLVGTSFPTIYDYALLPFLSRAVKVFGEEPVFASAPTLKRVLAAAREKLPGVAIEKL